MPMEEIILVENGDIEPVPNGIDHIHHENELAIWTAFLALRCFSVHINNIKMSERMDEDIIDKVAISLHPQPFSSEKSENGQSEWP